MALLRALHAGAAVCTMEVQDAAACVMNGNERSQRILQVGGASVPWSGPQAASWAALRSRLLAVVHTDLPQRSEEPPSMMQLSAAQRAALPQLHVQAVSAHNRSDVQLRARLRACRAASALLLVSGGARSRTLPSATPALLRLAAALRSDGELDENTLFAVAANTLRESPSALHDKLDAGAQVVVTQPALLPDRFAAWIDGAEDVRVPVLLGIALPCCSADVSFWLRLTDVPETDGDADALLRRWRAAEADCGAALAAQAEREARATLAVAGAFKQKLGGVHLMPLHAAGYALAARLGDALGLES